ncbi:glycine cleavage system aminomethyltransferase GcvT [Trueperella bialowiezensis]|uniref:Aminomethyltransferase n=1 Tax=Trueperella bialowiezensis TaxID=312285 RepID=A0A3S4VHB2_9ACTO|nr:glycine cleavage system aminomethyltransferase GcvT [Trueperella bialowiezensis]VEI14070.1 Aminomethyltransferase [Trueperella bialowiezensis]
MKHSPLHAVHESAGASFTDFGGWNMPLKFGKELDEHHAVRTAAGLFDVSHMGKIWITGPQAATGLNTALAGNFAAMSIGRARYTLALTAEGTILDDLIVYRFAEDRFLAIPNAGNAGVVLDALQTRLAGFDVVIRDETADHALMALQGPASLEVLRALAAPDLAERAAELTNYTAVELPELGVILARTGYTGELGYEIIIGAQQAPELWQALIDAGKPLGLLPCGLAARDSLRLEAGMALYGNELSTSITPFEAGLGGVVSFKKEEDFTGRSALEPHLGETPRRVLVGLVSEQRRAGRAGAALVVDGEQVGHITSGIPSPTLGHPIAMGYIDSEHSAPGTKVDVDVRGKGLPFTIVPLPFYTRAKK